MIIRMTTRSSASITGWLRLLFVTTATVSLSVLLSSFTMILPVASASLAVAVDTAAAAAAAGTQQDSGVAASTTTASPPAPLVGRSSQSVNKRVLRKRKHRGRQRRGRTLEQKQRLTDDTTAAIQEEQGQGQEQEEQGQPLPRLLRHNHQRHLHNHEKNEATGDDADAPYDVSEMQIVGGTMVGNPNAYPWFVHGDGCGGALIARDVVLTAAHCASDFARGKTIRVGSNQYRKGGQAKRVLNFVRHPQYDAATNDYDVALVKIQPASFNTKTVQFNTDGLLPSPGQGVKVMGFGGTLANVGGHGQSYPNKLQHVVVNAVSEAACRDQFAADGWAVNPQTMVCAGAPGRDACYGDSGGPLITLSKQQPVVVGVVSWGPNECAAPGKSGIYARVSAVSGWIRSTMCQMTNTNACSTGRKKKRAGANRGRNNKKGRKRQRAGANRRRNNKNGRRRRRNGGRF